MSHYRAALQRMFVLIGEDQPMMAELIGSYLAETPALLNRMRAAASAGDSRALGLAAHTLKSTARDFGAVHLAELCQDLETRGLDALTTGQIEVIAAALELSHNELVPLRNQYLSNGAALGRS
jgi:histidine phosphotransfer protein HptB